MSDAGTKLVFQTGTPPVMKGDMKIYIALMVMHEALNAERDELLKRLWPNREFGPQSFNEVATFIEQERQADKEYTDALAASNAELVDSLATAIGLVRLKYGNLDPDVSKFLVRAEAALARLSKGQDNAGS